jgi:pectate lyase
MKSIDRTHLRLRRRIAIVAAAGVWISTAIVLACGALSVAAAEHPVFPGAEGWGTTTPGGRNGKVLLVTSLADNGPGTLREALLSKGARTIVFRVSGIIRLEKPLWMCGPDYSFVTVAGQSAPGGGIAVTGNDFILSNGIHDVVFRHLRFRACNEGPTVHNQSKNIMFDHCSFSWASDENLDIYVDTTDVTISYCILAEGLIHGDHPKGAGHSCGLLAGKGADRVSIHHCFFTGNMARNPLLMGGNVRKWRDAHVLYPCFDVRNNLLYNARGGHLCVRAGPQVNVVGNCFVPGPDTLAHIPEIGLPDINDADETTEGTKIFVHDNLGPHLAGGDPWSIVYDEPHRVWGPRPEMYRSPQPISVPPVTTAPSQDVPRIVLEQAGALPHDSTDQRLVREFQERKGSCGAPDRRRDTPFPSPAPGLAPPDADQDGMPDAWELQHHLDATAANDCWADPDQDGYGNLEEYLNGTDPHAGR